MQIKRAILWRLAQQHSNSRSQDSVCVCVCAAAVVFSHTWSPNLLVSTPWVLSIWAWTMPGPIDTYFIFIIIVTVYVFAVWVVHAWGQRTALWHWLCPFIASIFTCSTISLALLHTLEKTEWQEQRSWTALQILLFGWFLIPAFISLLSLWLLHH